MYVSEVWEVALKAGKGQSSGHHEHTAPTGRSGAAQPLLTLWNRRTALGDTSSLGS